MTSFEERCEREDEEDRLARYAPRDFRPYAGRCVSCGRSNSVQQYGDHCPRCHDIPQTLTDTRTR